MKKKFLIILGSGLFLVFVFIGSLYTFSFRLNGKRKVEVIYGDTYKDLGYRANIFSISLANLVKTSNNVDTKKLGKYKVIYELPFKKLVREVNVVDKEKPNITLIGDEQILLTVNSEYVDPGYVVNDNVDTSLENKVVIENNIDNKKIGEYKVIYKVLDSSGNKEERERIVKVVDDIAPIINLKGLKHIIVKVNEKYDDEGVTALDNYDGDLTSKVKVSSNVNYNQVGTYYIKYMVDDSSLNHTEITRTIDVIENVDITYIKGILLVNKKYHLPANYNPGVNAEALSALNNLQIEARNNGYDIPLISGFRSYETQKYLFNSYAARNGYEKANTFSALPGQSEHQTGLAFDVGEISDNYGNTRAGIWLRDNAHRYGFIIRYLKGKENITGYKYEPWHIRYVGVNVATEIYNASITLEEYLGVA